jgi:hypothetical protein
MGVDIERQRLGHADGIGKLDCAAIKLEDFEEFENLQEFIIEQKQKMADLEISLTE